jgi:TDG/mug DNA glycosylase family protein
VGGAAGEWRPTSQQLAEAAGRTIPDVIAPGLQVLFCGINPGLWSGAVGHHFARPGNRFWKVLAGAGFTDRVLSPFEERQLLDVGVGVTNLVARATAQAAELTGDELRAGSRRLVAKVRRYRPACVAFVGLGAYRTAFGRPKATVGPLPDDVGPARGWLLPNPSGLQAHYQLPDLVAAFGDLRHSLEPCSLDPSPDRPIAQISQE